MRPMWMIPVVVASLALGAAAVRAAQYPGWGDTGWVYASKRECCNAAIDIAAQLARVPCKTIWVTKDQAWEGIIHTARSRKCDLIVMASHGRRGLTGLLLGSETTKVLTHSKIPVLVCR